MAHFSKVVVVLALGAASFSANAFYMSPLPPVGFSGGPGDYKYVPSPTTDQRFGRVTYTPNGPTVPAGASPVKLPVAYRWGAGVGRVAAGFVFMNPGIRMAVGIAGWLGLGKLIWDEVDKVWREIGDKDNPGGIGYSTVWAPGVQSSTMAAACQVGAAAHGDSEDVYNFVKVKIYPGGIGECEFNRVYQGSPSGKTYLGIESESVAAVPCPTGWTSTPAGCVSPAVPQPQFEDILAPKPMPDSVPWELPYPSPLPVEQPVINPEPGPDPLQRPKFVPTGDPVANPNYDPNAAPSPQNQPFVQPGYRIVPSPTATEPWRMDVQPVDRPVPTADPTVPVDEGPGQTNPGDKPKEDVPGLCDLYPDILACAKLDTPDGPDLPESEKPSPAITPDSGWGGDNASCPAPRMLTVQGQQIPIPYDIFCQYMSGLRPIIIAMAWLSAGFILIGARGGD